MAEPPRRDDEPVYRRNFFFFLLDNILFNLAMSIIGPTTLIPDFIRRLTRSEILIGLSATLFEVGSTLPQLFVARYLVRVERKKWWLVGPNIPARLVMLVFPVVTVALGKDRPEAILLAFLVCYGVSALGNGISSVAWWVMAGTSLDGRWRARVLGLTLASVGVLMLGITPLIGLVLGRAGPAFPDNYALLFGAAGLLLVLTIFPVAFIRELPGGPVPEALPPLSGYLPELGRMLRADHAFRAMVIARVLTALFAMASPFYIGFATVRLGLSSTVAVPTLLAMQVTGSLSGALMYTWLGGRSNLAYIRMSLGCAVVLPLSALLAAAVGPLPLYLGFLVSGLTGSNLLSGYLNWVITHAAPGQRPIYAGLFNTAVAASSLVAPVIGGTIAQQLGYEALFAAALAMVLGALFVTLRCLPGPRPPSIEAAAFGEIT